MDRHLTGNGCAQLVTLTPGNEQDGPFLMNGLIEKHLRGRTVVKLNRESGDFQHMAVWLRELGMDDKKISAAMRKAKKDGVTRSYLCVIHYERSGKKEIVVEEAARNYETWDQMVNGVKLTEESLRKPEA